MPKLLFKKEEIEIREALLEAADFVLSVSPICSIPGCKKVIIWHKVGDLWDLMKKEAAETYPDNVCVSHLAILPNGNFNDLMEQYDVHQNGLYHGQLRDKLLKAAKGL